MKRRHPPSSLIDGLGALAHAVKSAHVPEPHHSVSEWADRYRILTSETSAEVGRWHTDRTPYLREPMEHLSTGDPCPRVVLWFGAQVGKTETGLNWIGYCLHLAPAPFLLLRPTLDDCEGFSKQRLRPLLERPPLDALVVPARSRISGNTLMLKEFDGGLLILAGANAPARLASWPVRYLFADEIDRCAASAGAEGNPLELARKRKSTYGARAKELVTSTGTIKGYSPIETEYHHSSQAVYHVPCPRCGEYQPLTWTGIWYGDPHDRAPFGRMKVWGDPSGASLDFEVWYECGICGGRIDEYEKPRMLATGRWVHAHPDVPVKGYRLSSLYAPVGWIEEGGATGWKALAREWFRATSRAGQGDVEILKTFVMTRLGETWADTPGEGVDPMGIASRAEHADTAWKDAVPEGVHVVTAGVDVQDDRLEVEIVGWGAHFESWSLDYIVIRGDPVDPGVWQELDCLLANSYPGTRKDPSIDPPSFQVRACCIDMGGHRTQQVYEYCRTRERRMIYAVKGSPNRAAPVWDRKVKRSTVYRATFRIVGTHAAKDAIYARLQVERPGPGYCHFPEGRPDAYFQQLTAERKIKRHTAGRDIWVWECPPGHRNEALDCRVYAYAALLSWLAQGHLLPRAPTSSPAPSPASTTPEITPLTQPTYFRTSARHPSRTPWLQRKPRGWIRSSSR